jgi:hypothetical protein
MEIYSAMLPKGSELCTRLKYMNKIYNKGIELAEGGIVSKITLPYGNHREAIVPLTKKQKKMEVIKKICQ